MSAVEETTSILKSELTQKNQEQKEKQKGIKVEIVRLGITSLIYFNKLTNTILIKFKIIKFC